MPLRSTGPDLDGTVRMGIDAGAPSKKKNEVKETYHLLNRFKDLLLGNILQRFALGACWTGEIAAVPSSWH